MPRKRLFEYKGYWVTTISNSKYYYVEWYDERAGDTYRKSLKTKILDEAKERCVQWAGSVEFGHHDRSPEKVMLVSPLNHYYDNKARHQPSEEQARFAIGHILNFMGDLARVSDFDQMAQLAFMGHCSKQLGHSPSYIARNLSVVSAAFKYSVLPQIVENALGVRDTVVLLSHAPIVINQADKVSELLQLPETQPRDWLPTMAQLGAFLDSLTPRQENVFRFSMIALNTWARPAAIMDLRISRQVDFERGLVDLNPPGRRQTNKFRPTVRLTDTLRGWFEVWGSDAPLMWNCKPAKSVKRTFERQRERCNLPELTTGTFRHFMATQVRNIKPPIDRELRQVWLGHIRPKKDTTSWYETLDPDYLADAARGTEQVLSELQKHCNRPLRARKSRANVIDGSFAKKDIA